MTSDWGADDWVAWALRDPLPGERLRELHRTREITAYPELAAMVDVPQDPQWHPEGPVHVHVAHVLDAAAEIAEREALDPRERAVLMFAALTHDLGKPATTVLREKRDGSKRWTSYGHDRAGVPIARQFLEGIGMPEELIREVTPLVEHHMAYRAFSDPNAGTRTVRRLAWQLAPATLRRLGLLIEADHAGRPPLPPQVPEPARRMLVLAGEAGVLEGVTVPHTRQEPVGEPER